MKDVAEYVGPMGARLLAFHEIPTIDIAPLFGADGAARLATAKEIGHACETVGFFYIRNHGVPGAMIDRAYERSRQFHASPAEMKLLSRLVDHAILYYKDFVRPKKHYRAASAMERAALEDLAAALAALPAEADAETIQSEVFAVGKRHPFPDLRAWFACLYEVLLGQTEGPRFGAFAAIYGLAETIDLIRTALARTPTHAPADAA